MLNARSVILRNIAKDTRGTEIVESAFVLPLVFMFVIGIIWFGLVFLIYGTLAQGTRAGAGAAVAPVCATCGTTPSPAASAQTAVYNALAAAHLNKKNLVPWGGTSPKWTPPTLCTCGTVTSSSACTKAASCDSTVSDVCVQGVPPLTVQLSYPSQGGAGTCGVSVSARYQYPYHFSIPLTTLDIGNVLVPGQAQMRAETQ
ncbi:MAG: TadE family protein [Candidatus Sulfotelmatobacter sp.]|jgi:Flp pilus assembly protein TadG